MWCDSPSLENSPPCLLSESFAHQSKENKRMRYFVKVTICHAKDLMPADITGFSDPYCVLYITDFEGNVVNPKSRKRNLPIQDFNNNETRKRRSFDLKQTISNAVQFQNYSDNRGYGKRQTQVVMKNLNPEWNETINLETSPHPLTDTLVLFFSW